MTNPFRKTALGLFAVAAAMTMPFAFAQAVPATPTQSAASPPPAATTVAPVPATPVPQSANTQASTSTDLAAGSGHRKTWNELDTNKDGNISKSEATADVALNELFAKADANGDGILTPDEYRAYLAAASASRK